MNLRKHNAQNPREQGIKYFVELIDEFILELGQPCRGEVRGLPSTAGSHVAGIVPWV